MNIDLSAKVVLVTGGNKGIGLAITRQLLESGAKVCSVYSNSEPEEELKENTNFFALKTNLQDKDKLESIVNKSIDVFGQLDVLINNAGIALSSPINSPLSDWFTAWDTTMKVNLLAAATLCRESINYFQSNKKEGIIINISSRAAFRGDTEEYLAYAASKGGLMSLTRSIARAFGKKGIIAYDVAPGFTHTEMANQFIEEYGEEWASKDIALKNLTKPEDIAPLIAFLASGLAKHATGTSIQVNAGSYVH